MHSCMLFRVFHEVSVYSTISISLYNFKGQSFNISGYNYKMTIITILIYVNFLFSQFKNKVCFLRLN